MLIFGTQLYGRCDAIPGLGQVATRFAHIWYIPLIPLQTMVVTSEEGDGWRGIPISMSAKSVLVAWTRAACVLLVLSSVVWGGFGAVAFLTSFSLASLATAVLGALTFGGGIVAWLVIGRLTRLASEERQRQLLVRIGVIDEAHSMSA